MLHEPAMQEMEKDNSIPKKTKLGVILFFVYLVIYGGFVYIGTISPKTMGLEIIGGQNLAFIYGMGLIVFAIILGLIYNWLCTNYENKLNRRV